MKGSIKNNLDETTSEIKCEIYSEFSGEGQDCFSDTVTLEMVGNLIEDGKLINFIFMLSSGNRISFLVERPINN